MEAAMACLTRQLGKQDEFLLPVFIWGNFIRLAVLSAHMWNILKLGPNAGILEGGPVSVLQDGRMRLKFK